MGIHISEEDYKFLKELQNEFLTQNTCGQALPRFWVIKDIRRIYGIGEEYSDKYCICDEESECWDSETEISLEDWLNEELEDTEIELDKNLDLSDLKEVVNWLSRETRRSYDLIYYEDEEFIVPDTMFLTLKDAQDHLKSKGM